jgi:hypothetical protein
LVKPSSLIAFLARRARIKGTATTKTQLITNAIRPSINCARTKKIMTPKTINNQFGNDFLILLTPL